MNDTCSDFWCISFETCISFVDDGCNFCYFRLCKHCVYFDLILEKCVKLGGDSE